MEQLLVSWFLVLSIGCISKGSPRIDDFNNENSVEYHYRYAIDESKSKGPVMDRWEHRVGEYVKGSYSVMQPDGKIRTVDYEVDGEKGYHAIIRMSEPYPKLLSVQQLTKAIEVYPPAPLPTPQQKSDFVPQETQSGKWWNYHSNVPHINQLGSKGDYKASATNVVTKSTAVPFNKSEIAPPSPANFNVPQTTNLIYFIKPAGDITPKGFTHSKISEDKPFKPQEIKPFVLPDPVQRFELTEETPRRRRNSRLVRRFKSFAEAFS